MQLVIEIPNELYDDYKTIPKTEIDDYGALIDRAIYYGTPLPKGHGRLKDEDEIVKAIEDRVEFLKRMMQYLCGCVRTLIF